MNKLDARYQQLSKKYRRLQLSLVGLLVLQVVMFVALFWRS